jgi:hypothetical protein
VCKITLFTVEPDEIAAGIGGRGFTCLVKVLCGIKELLSTGLDSFMLRLVTITEEIR